MEADGVKEGKGMARGADWSVFLKQLYNVKRYVCVYVYINIPLLRMVPFIPFIYWPFPSTFSLSRDKLLCDVFFLLQLGCFRYSDIERDYFG